MWLTHLLPFSSACMSRLRVSVVFLIDLPSSEELTSIGSNLPESCVDLASAYDKKKIFFNVSVFLRQGNSKRLMDCSISFPSGLSFLNKMWIFLCSKVVYWTTGIEKLFPKLELHYCCHYLHYSEELSIIKQKITSPYLKILLLIYYVNLRVFLEKCNDLIVRH